jgi:hypothetical protein
LQDALSREAGRPSPFHAIARPFPCRRAIDRRLFSDRPRRRTVRQLSSRVHRRPSTKRRRRNVSGCQTPTRRWATSAARRRTRRPITAGQFKSRGRRSRGIAGRQRRRTGRQPPIPDRRCARTEPRRRNFERRVINRRRRRRRRDQSAHHRPRRTALRPPVAPNTAALFGDDRMADGCSAISCSAIRHSTISP